MDKFQTMKAFIATALEYSKHRTEKLWNTLFRHLQILGVTPGLSIFDPGNSVTVEFFVSLHELMSSLDSSCSVLWIAMDVLRHACGNLAARQALIHTYKFTSILTTLLGANLIEEKKIRALRLLQELTYGVKISWQEAHLPYLVSTLTTWIVNGEREVIDLSLGVLVNLCYKNLPAVYTLKRAVDSKEFLRTILKLQNDNINTRVQKSQNKRKWDNSSSDYGGEKPINKKKTQQESDSDIAVIEPKEERNGKDEILEKNRTKKSERNLEEDEFPNELDSEGVKEAKDLFTVHLNDIIHIGELITYRAKRLVNKKISESDLVDPKKVDKVLDNINLLLKLASENMQHTGEFLNSQHKHWVKQVKKRYRKAKTKPEALTRIAEKLMLKKDEEKMEDICVDTSLKNDSTATRENTTLDSKTDTGEETEGSVVDKHDSKSNAAKRKIREENNDSETAEDYDNTIGCSKKEKQVKKKPKVLENCAKNEESSSESKNGDAQSDESESEGQVKRTKVEEEDNSEKEGKEDSKKKNAGLSSKYLSLLELPSTSEAQPDRNISSMTTVKVEKLNDTSEDMFAGDIPLEDDQKQHKSEDGLSTSSKGCKSDDKEIRDKLTEVGDSSDDAAYN